MRQLFRGGTGIGAGFARRFGARGGRLLLAGAGLALALILAPVRPLAAPQGLAIRITSPLGRSGIEGTIRIVARVQFPPNTPPPIVTFSVDGEVLKVVSDGPPYSAEWIDVNPFERREIVAEAAASSGETSRDHIVLAPFEITEVTQVTSVLLEAGVYSTTGRFVSGLGPGDFVVKENGEPQKIELVRHEAVPATFALLIDSSQSMSRRMDFVHTAAEHLAGYLRPQDRVVVAPFARALRAITGPTSDKKTVTEAIDAIKPGGGTAILDSVIEMARRLEGTEGRHVVILITDGYDENSKSTLDEALKALHDARVTVYAVGIGGVAGISLKGERVLKRMATDTGGRTFFPPREQELGLVYDVLAADAQNRYLITYTPSNQSLDGAWRAIQLATVRDNVVVQARLGYFAPQPPPIRPSIEFTVTDENQRYVDVMAEDLEVVEDGVEQKVETFHEAVSPVSVILALDASGSMKKSSEAVVAAARSFVDAIRPEDALAVVMFADKSTMIQDSSTDRDRSYEAIDEYRANGGTALYDALADSLTRLKRVEGRRAIVVVTDGRDEDNPGTGPGSARSFDDVLALLKEAGATVFCVGLGSKVDQRPLEELAKLSGGQAYFPADVGSLPENYARIVENLRRRFALSYTSSHPARDGKWRKVEIRVRGSKLLVSSPGGYFAPDR